MFFIVWFLTMLVFLHDKTPKEVGQANLQAMVIIATVAGFAAQLVHLTCKVGDIASELKKKRESK